MFVKIQEEISGAVERRILIAMITNKSVLGRITARWDGRLFRSPWSNSLAQLCTDFYKKHNEAPGKAIDSLYESWLESQRDQEGSLKMGEFLAGLGGDYRVVQDDINPEHVIDLAGKHFRQVRQEALLTAIQAATSAHDEERVDKLLAAYRKVELGIGAGINFFIDQEEIKSVFTVDDSDLLVEYPDALGEFFGSDMSRDCFVVFQGVAKSSKSHWIQDVAWRAMLSRKKVAYFEAGDMSRRQVERRFIVRATGIPWRSTSKKEPYWPCSLEYPTNMSVEPDEKTGKRRGFVTESRTMTFDKPNDYETAWRACEKVMKTQIRSKKPYFKLSVHPNSTLTVDMIKTVLDGYAVDDWFCDVLIIDYADILSPPPGTRDERDAINTTWKQLRKLSQEYHNLVVTATQADADAYGQETQTRKNFSGDRRKNDHITAIYGINQTDDEKERGICRLNVLGRREDDFSGRKCIHVAQCLALGRPSVLSSF